MAQVQGRSRRWASSLGARSERPSKPPEGAEEHLAAVRGGAQPGADGGEVAPERPKAAQRGRERRAPGAPHRRRSPCT